MTYRIRCFTALLLCLLVLTDAKFGRRKKADRDGHVRFQGRQSQGSRSVELNYDATLKVNPDDVIDLDDIRPASVECYSSGSVVVVFNEGSVMNSFRDVNETKSPLNWTAGDIIVGGSEYGCSIDNAPHDLMRRITRLTRFNFRYVLQTVTADLKDVFSELNGTLEVIRTETIRQEPVFASHDISDAQEVISLPEPNTTRTKRSTGPINLTSPAKRDNFIAPEPLTISFTTTFTGSVSVSIYRDVTGFDPTIFSTTVSAIAGQVIQITVSTVDVTASTYYYVQFQRDGSTIYEMRYFSINYRENGFFSSPAPTSEYYFGGNINVLFMLTGNYQVQVTLYQNIDFGFDEDRYTTSVSVIGGQTKNVTIPVGSTWAQSNNYYIELKWDCGTFFCTSANSEYFTIRRNHTQQAIQFSSPLSTDVYLAGQNIKLSWYSDTNITDSTIYLKQERNGPDPTRYTTTFAPFPSGSWYFNIPIAAWSGSSSYYIEMRYNCKSEDFCEIVQTNRFSIAFRKDVTFVSPIAKKRYTIGDTMLLDWTTSKTTAYVSLVVDYPIYIPFVSPLWQGTLNLQQSYNLQVTPAFTSSFPVHFEVAYDCAYQNFHCTIERGPQFFIAQTYTADYNYNPVTGRADDVINIFTRDCDSLGFAADSTCPADTFMTPVCEFCSAGGELEIKLDCDNCWVKTEVTLSVITFSLTTVNVEIFSDLDLNLDLLLTVQGKFRQESQVLLTPNGIPIFGYPLNLYLFTTSVGLTANVYFRYEYEVLATGTVSMGFDISVPLNLKIDTSDASEFRPSLEFNKHGPEIRVEGSVTGKAELILELKLNALSILEFDAQVIPYATLDGQFQVPPFAALPGVLVSDSKFHFGNCTMQHLVQYEIDVGLNVAFIVSALSEEVWSDEYAVIDPFPLVSGCLLQVVRFETLCFEFNTVPAQIGLGQDSFASLFVRDLILGVNSALTTDQFFKSSFDVDGLTTEVCFLVLDKNGLTIEQIVSEISTEISNGDSRLYDTQVSYVSPYLIQPVAPIPVIAPVQAQSPEEPPLEPLPDVEPVSAPVEQDTPINDDAPVDEETPVSVPTADEPISVPVQAEDPPISDTPIAEPIAEPTSTPFNAPVQDQEPPVDNRPPLDVPSSDVPTVAPVTTPEQDSPVADDTPISSPIATPVTSPVSAPLDEPVSVPVTSPTVPDTPIAVPVTSPTTVPVTTPTMVPVTTPTSPTPNSPISGSVPTGNNVPIELVSPDVTPQIETVVPQSNNQAPNNSPRVQDAQGQISSGPVVAQDLMILASIVIACVI
jgi:hypothetical protein